MIWLVTSGWMGNGREAALVEADNEGDALAQAIKALSADARQRGEYGRDRLESYVTDPGQFTARPLTLPHVLEVDG
jgi:hypothetical protein